MFLRSIQIEYWLKMDYAPHQEIALNSYGTHENINPFLLNECASSFVHFV